MRGPQDEVQRTVEIPREIGVGHVAPAEGFEIHRQPRGPARIHLGEIRVVLGVHGEDQVEAREIRGPHLPGAQRREVEAPGTGCLLHGRVGRFAHMPVTDARAVDLGPVAQHGAQGGLGRGRAADVT